MCVTNADACPQGPAAAAPPPPKKDDDAEDDSKFDEFMGADTALLAGTTGEYDKDDKEADEIWAHVDDFMDDRRRVRFHLHSGPSSADASTVQRKNHTECVSKLISY